MHGTEIFVLSFCSVGTLLFLSLALFVFTREPHQCILQLAQPNGVVMAALNKLLEPDFLEYLAQT